MCLLEKKLLSYGGTKVVMPENLPDIFFNLGHLYKLYVRVIPEGTSKYFLEHESDVRVIWGFVLDDYGVWRIHSWLVDKVNCEILDKMRYNLYYGFIKTDIKF